MKTVLILAISLLILSFLSVGPSDARTTPSKSVPSAVPKGKKDNPGAVLKISKNGFDYVIESMGEVMNRVLEDFKADKVSVDLADKGDVTLRDVEVYEFKEPDYIGELRDDEINLKIKDLKKIALRGIIDAKVMGYTLEGPIGATLHDANADVTASLGARKDLPEVKIEDCDISVGKLEMDLAKVKGSGAGLARAFKGTIESMGKKEMGKIMCQYAKDGVEEGLNTHFEEMSGTASLSNDKQKRDRMSSGTKSTLSNAGISDPDKIFDVDMEDYEIDYRFAHKKDPEVTKDYIQTFHRGEISHKGKGGVPFHAEKLPSLEDREKKHFYILLSDYVWNSLLYSMNGQKDLDIDLKDSRFEGSHTLSDMPYCLVEDKKMPLRMEGRGDIQKFSGSRVSESGATELDGEIKPEFRKTGIIGEVKMDDFSWAGGDSHSSKARNALQTMVQVFIDELLIRGVPAEITEYMTFRNSDINLKHDHALELETDIRLDERKIANKITEAILKELSR